MTVDEAAAVLVATGVAAYPFAVGLAASELALILCAVIQFQATGTIVQVSLEATPLQQALLFLSSFAFATALF